MACERGTAWIVATGALTNVALAFATFPELAGHLRGLSIMGGAVGGGFADVMRESNKDGSERCGNVTKWAEFNIYVSHYVGCCDGSCRNEGVEANTNLV